MKTLIKLWILNRRLKKKLTEKQRRNLYKRWYQYTKLPAAKIHPKHGRVRNILASILKQLREEFPYQPKDYSEAKRLYDLHYSDASYVQSPDDLKEGDLVTVYRRDIAYKGERWEQYKHYPHTQKLGVYRIVDTNFGLTADHLNGEDYLGLDEINISCMAHPTDPEIKRYHDDRKTLEAISLEEKKLHKRLEELQKQKYAIYG
jgi:hypothetical protein